ncbi:hypothetical protein ACIP5U_34440 [Streptomyces sp. NPDC088788]|uniref:hypothetical protein n=1 Tax=Streptomyces sp. NPDC088788 TaxID=3365898 RepID=UPI00381E6097
MPRVCALCGSELYLRGDDREQTVRKRLEVFLTESAPVIDHYQAQGLVVAISAHGQGHEVLDRVLDALGQGKGDAADTSS